METTKCVFKHKMGAEVFNKNWEEGDVVINRRVIHGQPYYYLRNDPSVIHESRLIGVDEWGKKRD